MLEYFLVRPHKGAYYFKRFEAYQALIDGKKPKIKVKIKGKNRKYKAAPLNHDLIRHTWGGIWLGKAIHDGDWHVVIKGDQNSDKFDEYKAQAKAKGWLFDPTNKQEKSVFGN